jgi:hypothetical protein
LQSCSWATERIGNWFWDPWQLCDNKFELPLATE